MFTEEEIEALVLGARWVAERTDSQLSEGAKSALNKIAAVLPIELKNILDDTSLLIGPSKEPLVDSVNMADIRRAIRDERILSIVYRDLKDNQSERRIWPFALGYFDEVRVLVA